MRYIPRSLGDELRKATRHFPAVILTGPRRAGKTTLLQRLFPNATYVLVEDPDVIARVRADPNAFLDEVETPAILDEVQHVPELLNYIRSRIDRHPRRFGQWLLTGSQESSLMQGVTESMAGRRSRRASSSETVMAFSTVTSGPRHYRPGSTLANFYPFEGQCRTRPC